MLWAAVMYIPRTLDTHNKPSLGRSLGTLDVTLLGIGAIIGGGIFASIGSAAVGSPGHEGAGPSLVVSVALTAWVCLLTAVCYSELAALMPTSGSAYAYTRRAFGSQIGWLIGWCLTLEYAVANVAVAISWGEYAATFAHPLLQALGVVTASQPSRWLTRLLGAGIVLLLTATLIRGTRESSRLNNILVVFKVGILLFFVGLGLSTVSGDSLWQNWQPFQPHGWSGTLYGSAVIFFAFIGFDSVATVAEEVKDPQRSIPLGIFGSLFACALLYMAVAAVLTGVAPLATLSQRLAAGASQPLTAVLGLLGDRVSWASPIIAFGALVAQTTALLAFQLAQARIFFAMARDGLLPSAFGKIHPRYRTPHVASWWACAVVAVGTLLFDMDAMLDLTDIGTLFIFCVTNASVPVLRARCGDSRSFKVPFGPYVCPLAGVLSCLALMLCLPGLAWLALGGWLLLGFLIHQVSLRRAVHV